MSKLLLGNKESIYGIPREENGWEKFPEENLFPCWNCEDWLPWFCFNKNFSGEIERREAGYFKCCKECSNTLTRKIVQIP